VIVTGGLT